MEFRHNVQLEAQPTGNNKLTLLLNDIVTIECLLCYRA